MTASYNGVCQLADMANEKIACERSWLAEFRGSVPI
jgi:hypothetical protein